ncbi:hypothetical protein DL240_14055 [Lujinxingia litoralis]|uniref:HAMP domain-containing protein n=1 Tax=Lujinxingia litoralis TaxID=2211119 RepID=A0A328C7X8_9DELT|nr:hypothetical protein DL240_14055 [Lujinxingia litoralis]
MLGYGYMAVLVLLTAGGAAFGFFSISEAIDRILSENFRSVTASVEMMEALEHQNTMTMSALLTRESTDDALATSDRAFYAALERAEANATIEGEAELIAELRANYLGYIEVRDRMLGRSHAEPMEIFSEEIFPAYIRARQQTFELLDRNHQAIIEADRAARMTALQTAGWLGLLVTVALFSMVFLARALQQKILVRLDELNDVAEAMLIGEHWRRFDMSENDELGMVARQLNAALDARDELQSEMRGRINQQKQLVLGLIWGIPGERLLVGLDSHLIASTWTGEEGEAIEATLAWLRERRREVLEEFRQEQKAAVIDARFEGIDVQIRLLATQDGRPVGWLVRRLREQDPGEDEEQAPSPPAEGPSAPRSSVD